MKLTIVSLLLPFKATLAVNPAVGTPTTQQAQQLNQQQENTDRSNSSGAAQAMAAMGAAMAGMGCMMGLKAAQEETDPAQKQMMMSMAMQQCSQAAQNAASAAQNGDQKKKLDSPAPIQLPPVQAPEIQVPEDEKSVDLSKLAQDEKKSESESKDTNKVEPAPPPTLATTEKKASVETKSAPLPELKATKSIPALIGADTITAKKEDKENNNTQSNDAVKNLGSALAGKGSADDLLKKALAETGANINETPRIQPRGSSNRKNGAEAEGGGGSESGASSGGEGGNSPFDSLLAQMMGGGQPGPGMAMALGGDSDVINIVKDRNGQPKLNIFQFASTVYSELARTQNRVTYRPTKPLSPVNRVLSSEPNLVTKASAR